MPPKDRKKLMTVRLSEDEEALRDALELYLGTDVASVMRHGLLELGRNNGFEFPLKKKETFHPKHAPLSKKERPPPKR